MKSFSIKKKKSIHLKKDEIKEICKLKNSFWKYGIKKNLEWFKDNIEDNDIHIIMKYDKKIIGYNLLRIRNVFEGSKKKPFYYFDTLIIHKKFRGKKLSNKILKYNNKIFNKKKIRGFLICKKETQTLYEKLGWKKLINSKFSIKGKVQKKNFVGMINSHKKFRSKQKSIYYLNLIYKKAELFEVTN